MSFSKRSVCLVAGTKWPTEAAVEEEGVNSPHGLGVQSVTAGSHDCESWRSWPHCVCSHEAERGTLRSACRLLSLQSRIPLMGWCHPPLGRVFPLSQTYPETTLISIVPHNQDQRFIVSVLLDPVMSMIHVNSHMCQELFCMLTYMNTNSRLSWSFKTCNICSLDHLSLALPR